MTQRTLKRRDKVLIGVAIALISTVTFAFYCPPQYQENTVVPMFESAQQSLDESIQAIDSTFSSTLDLYSQRIDSAIAVLTKQKALAANQIGDANRSAAEMTADSLNVLAQTDRVKQARFEFGGEFGQGYQPCLVYAGRNLLTNRDAEMGEERRERMMSEVTAAPGKYAERHQAIAQQEKDHRDNYCTQDQVDSGMCATVGKMAGKSLNVATLFEPAMESDDLYKAKVAFVNNVVPPPDAPVPQSAGKTPAAAAYVLAKAQKDALMSPALTSFKDIQVEYSGIDSAHNGSDIPVASRIEREVKRYLGNTPEYETWVQTMTAQNSRGLLVEMLKVKALDLMLLERQYHQYERMEANLATLVAGEARQQAVSTDAAATMASRQDVQGQIK
jgi:hypothetical protein